MDNNIQYIFSLFEKDSDGIFCSVFRNYAQEQEQYIRQQVASVKYTDYLEEIMKHHSIPVMDYEINLFLKSIPSDGIVLDIGGCWGLHWRKIKYLRNDVKVIILDFVKENLLHAKKILDEQINKSIYLVHGDATQLKFPEASFNGVWTVQVFQHIPNYKTAVQEAYRVLKNNGVFANYSLNIQPHVQWIYKLLGKNYIIKNYLSNKIWLARASIEQKNIIEDVFNSSAKERCSEILYSPELHFSLPGREKSWLGIIDKYLSNNFKILTWLARQKSFHCIKYS